MSSYKECEAMVKEKANTMSDSRSGGVTLTDDEAQALSNYLDVYMPSNLRNDEEWDNLTWLHNIMTAWKKLDTRDKEIEARKKESCTKIYPETY